MDIFLKPFTGPLLVVPVAGLACAGSAVLLALLIHVVCRACGYSAIMLPASFSKLWFPYWTSGDEGTSPLHEVVNADAFDVLDPIWSYRAKQFPRTIVSKRDEACFSNETAQCMIQLQVAAAILAVFVVGWLVPSWHDFLESPIQSNQTTTHVQPSSALSAESDLRAGYAYFESDRRVLSLAGSLGISIGVAVLAGVLMSIVLQIS